MIFRVKVNGTVGRRIYYVDASSIKDEGVWAMEDACRKQAIQSYEGNTHMMGSWEIQPVTSSWSFLLWLVDKTPPEEENTSLPTIVATPPAKPMTAMEKALANI